MCFAFDSVLQAIGSSILNREEQQRRIIDRSEIHGLAVMMTKVKIPAIITIHSPLLAEGSGPCA